LKPIVKSSDRMLALTQGGIQWTNTGVLSVIVEMAKGNDSFYWFANVDDSPGAEGLLVQPGIVLGTSRTAKALFDPFLSIIRPLPSLSWIPPTILWFGIDEGQKYAIVFMGTFASALLYVMESRRRVDPLLIKAAQNLGATRLDVLREVILPGSLPGIISGLKVCLALAWTCLLSAEMVAATHGLGALIWFAKDWNNMALVMVGMVSISATVLVIDSAFRVIEDRILPWERHRRRRDA